MTSEFKRGYKLGYGDALKDCRRVIEDLRKWRGEHPGYSDEDEERFKDEYLARFGGPNAETQPQKNTAHCDTI